MLTALPDTTKPQTILIVDDELQALDTCAKGLQACSSHYTVLKADTVSSALDLCRYHRFDCVVLDLDMTNTSGFEVLLTLVPDRASIERSRWWSLRG